MIHQSLGLVSQIAVTSHVPLQRILFSLSRVSQLNQMQIISWMQLVKEKPKNFKSSHQILVTAARLTHACGRHLGMPTDVRLTIWVFFFSRVKTLINLIEQCNQSISRCGTAQTHRVSLMHSWTTFGMDFIQDRSEDQDSQVWFGLHQTWSTTL